MKSKSTARFSNVLLLLLLATTLKCFTLQQHATGQKKLDTAQTASPASVPKPAQPDSKVYAASAPETANQEPARATDPAASQTPEVAAAPGTREVEEPADEEAAFRSSPAVHFISRLTGLSLNSAYWLCVILNFVIVAVVLWLLLRSNLPAMFRERTQQIQKGIEEARRASEDAGRRLLDIETRLTRLGAEIDEMQKHAEAESRAEEERIHATIEEEKRKILDAAKQEIGQAESAARRELQKHAAELAIALAEKGIRVEASEDKMLVEDFAEQLAAETHRDGHR